jgi:hypothetical protein
MPASESQPKAEPKAPAAAKRPKPRPKAKPKPKASPYTDEVREVAKATRATLGEKVKAPGAKQVAAVVKALGDRDPAKAAGVSSARLRKWAAEGERPKDFANLRELAGQVGDPWATGRKLAAILVSIESVRKAGGAR